MDNALTIDLEEWFHPELIRRRVRAEDKFCQINESVEPILELLNRHRVEATFFVVGELAKRFPDLVRKIYSSGHEIAFHGMSHRPLWEMDKISFKRELEEFKAIIADILGKPIGVKGHRAPSFSMNESTKWALDVLKDNEYVYDSSLFPIKNYLFGVEGIPLDIYRPHSDNLKMHDPNQKLFEFPMTVYKFGRLKIPVCGGFYLRALPLPIVVTLLKKINRQRPFVIYLHPWESYIKTPRVTLPIVSRFITYYGISGMCNKVERLLHMFSFRPMREIIKQCIA